MKLLVLLPTYNEKDNLERMVNTVLHLGERPAMGRLGVAAVRVVVVDDDSPDGTGELADQLSQRNPGSVHVIHRKERGRGTAGIAGFKYALTQDVDCIIEMDADFSHNPADIPRFLAKAGSCDVVIGSRYAPGGHSGKRSVIRHLISRGASLYARLVLGMSIKEWHGGYKCYSRSALASLDFDGFLSKGYSIGMETLYRLLKLGFSYEEIPITFQERARGESKFRPREVLDYARVALQLRCSGKRDGR